MKRKSENHKENSIFRIFLIPLIAIMLIQGLLTLATLIGGRIFSTIQGYSASMMARTVENRKVVLENDMVRCASTVYNLESILNGILEEYLKEQNITVDEMLSSGDRRQEFLTVLFPECTDTLQNIQTTGIFLILTGEDIQTPAAYEGFFVRDSDPVVNTANNTDLLFERGSKELSRAYDVPLDTYWGTYFQMEGQGKRASDAFFYEPWRAGIQHPDAAASDLGYWSLPFILEDDSKDSHEMITYSIPLCYDGKVYGVFGIEISVNLLYDYFPLSELNENEQSGYMLALDNGDGSYRALTGKGILYNSIRANADDFKLLVQKYDTLYEVADVLSGSQKIYAVSIPLKLYGDYAPYENVRWALVGLDGEEDLFGMSSRLYIGICTAILFGLVFGVIGIYICVLHLTRPIQNLMHCIDGGSAGLKDFQTSKILEIDALYGVIQDLTNRQKESENTLLEEKERYRLALENTNDIFFTYDYEKEVLDIVNHPTLDGTWERGGKGFIDFNDVYYEDRAALKNLHDDITDNTYVEFRLKCDEGDFVWYGLYGRVVKDAEGNRLKLVGSLRNINEQKKKEALQRAKMSIDGITGFYSYNAGMERLEQCRAVHPEGSMVYFLVDKLRELNETNGIVFGDMVLEQIGQSVRGCCERLMVKEHGQTIAVRFNSDEFILWIEYLQREEVESLLQEIFHAFDGLFDRDVLQVSVYAGVAATTEKNSSIELIRMAKLARTHLKDNSLKRYYFYEDLTDKEREVLPKAWGRQMISNDYGEEVNLSSLALNLFGRGANMQAQMMLLLRKIGSHYGASDVLTTIIRSDFYSNYLEYQWHKDETPPMENANQYTDKEWKDFQEWLGSAQIRSLTTADSRWAVLQKFLNITDGQFGVVLPMYDSGSYMGNICILGIDPKIVQNAEERQKLTEVGGVIQSQINQQQHDIASKAKSRFLSRMSHEIRTPMNGIIGMTAIALQNDQSKERMLDCLKKIQDSSQYLLGLINDILDMSKIESGKMTLEPENFDIREMLNTVCELLRPQIATKEIEFVKEFEIDHNYFFADKMRISQVLVNLLSNAAKFTPQGGKIILSVKEESEQEQIPLLHFAVQDNGVGISKEEQERVFRSFEQVKDASSVSKQQGTGLGLSISSRLVQMMGSTIKLESELGEGSCFSFAISLPEGQAEETIEEEESVSFENFRVLIVEDNELNMEIAKCLLEEIGFKTDCAYNGAEAVEKIKELPPHSYDLILMDIMMPVMDGLDATRTIRGMDREDCKTIPIVAMSANAFDDDLKKSVECGMNGHLSKPVEVDKLYQMLKNILYPSEK